MKRRRKKQNIQKSYIRKIFGLIVAITDSGTQGDEGTTGRGFA